MWTKEARIQHAPREERYPSDVTDAEWAIIAPMIPPQRQSGRRIRHVEASPYRCMAISLFLAYIVTDQIETHWQGSYLDYLSNQGT